jgi:Domain of unknown function (DUF4395)
MEIDPRGPRTAALITTAVLAAVLITGSGWLLVFAVVGVAGYATGLTLLGVAATAAALVAAFLNGAFGFCLGCEMYLLIRRIRPGRQALADPGLAENVAGR